MTQTDLVAVADTVRAFTEREFGVFIDGAMRAAHSPRRLDVFDPATGARLSRVPDADAHDVDAAVASAQRAFDARAWSGLRPAERERILLKLADVLEAHAEELAQLETLNQGKSILVSRGVEVGATIEYVRYMAGWATKITGQTLDVSIPFPPGARYTAYLIIERREKMALRSLGTSTIQVSPLVFGGNVFGWTADENTSFSLLDALADAGINFIDTADVYSAWVPGNQGGESETIIGKWLKRSGKRDQVVIATKVGLLETRAGLSRENILKAADDSLRRLQTDYIDLYFSHRDLADTAPLEETLGAYQTLIEQGKVRIIGASNYSGARLREAAELSRRTGLPAYQVIQPEYNLYDREAYERDLEPAATELRLGVVTYYALASGFLSGKYRSEADLKKSARGRRVEQYLNPRGLRILAALDAVAAKHGSTQTSVALAWQMARPSVTAPIASATSLEQLSALGAAIRLQLDAHDIRQLDDASAP